MLSLFLLFVIATPSFLAASLHRAESGDDPDPQHQCGDSGPVRSQAHRPQCSEARRQEEERPVQEAHRRNRWGNATFSA